MLSPCSFHSSWSCAALRQGHPASRDQLTDQEQCEAAKQITTRAKILSIDGPKTKRQKCSGSRVAKVGLPSSRTCVGMNIRRAWRTIARGAAKPWEPSGTAVCETSVAYLRKQTKLALFFDRRQKFRRQTAPVLGFRNGPQNGGQVVRTQANQIETE